MADGDREVDAPLTRRARIIAGALVIACVIAAVALFMRLGAPRIRPAQPAPGGHYGGRCTLCHVQDPAAPAIEVGR